MAPEQRAASQKAGEGELRVTEQHGRSVDQMLKVSKVGLGSKHKGHHRRPLTRGRGLRMRVVLQQRSAVPRSPPTTTHGTKEHLALETGQTLALRPPAKPPLRRQVDSSQEYQGDGDFLPPTLSWSLAKGALSCSPAGCQRDKQRVSRSHTLLKNPLLHDTHKRARPHNTPHLSPSG